MVAAGGRVRVMMSVEEREREEKAEKPEEKPSLNGRGLAVADWTPWTGWIVKVLGT
jgi:hypothetical protein